MFQPTSTARNLGHLGFCPAAGCVPLAIGMGPVGVAIVLGVSVVGLYMTFKDWFQRGELKIAATAKAEEYVKTIWGTLEPNSPPTEDSVSKLIEECRLDEALELIQFLARQMYEKAQRDSYFKRWMDEWGTLTLQQVYSKLEAYKGYCVSSQPAPTCPEGYVFDGNGCTQTCAEGFRFSLADQKCIAVSPPILPPAISPTGEYIPLSAGISPWWILALGAFGIVLVTR